MDTNFVHFNSIEEECSYWKEKARLALKEKNDTQRELEDFTDESRQLEAELEASLTQSERQVRELKQTLNNMTLENESLKKKLQVQENESNSMETKYTQTFKEKENLKAYIRELEQKNDDLERANRVVSESVAGFEAMLNQAYEKNALLENEVDEKEQMQIKLQRLMDEARDLKQELKVRNTTKSSLPYEDISLTNPSNNNPQSDTSTGMLQNLSLNGDSGSDALERLRGGSRLSSGATNAADNMTSTASNNMKQQLNNQNNNLSTLNNSTSTIVGNCNGTLHNTSLNGAMPTSARVSALSIVSDLLRKLDLIRKNSIYSRTNPPTTENDSSACGDTSNQPQHGDDEYANVAISTQLRLFFRHLIMTTLSTDDNGSIDAAVEVEEFYKRRKAEREQLALSGSSENEPSL